MAEAKRDACLGVEEGPVDGALGDAHPLAWRDNIPLVSFALNRGRCRYCGAAIPWRYPAIEAFVAVGFTALTLLLGVSLGLLVSIIVFAVLTAATVMIVER